MPETSLAVMHRPADRALFAFCFIVAILSGLGCGSRTPLESEPEYPGIILPTTGKTPAACTSVNPTEIFILTDDRELWAFNPAHTTWRSIGTLNCGELGIPFSMAVRRDGIAFAIFSNGKLFAIDTQTAACTATPFDPAQLNGGLFGMSYVASPDGLSETLYVALTDGKLKTPVTLGHLSTDDFRLHLVDEVHPTLGPSELAGTGAGRLFAYTPPFDNESDARIVELDRNSARIVAANSLPLPPLIEESFGMAQWGGQFWIVRSGAARPTPPEGSPVRTFVWRFRPSDQSFVSVTEFTGSFSSVVGAGAPSCAPL